VQKSGVNYTFCDRLFLLTIYKEGYDCGVSLSCLVGYLRTTQPNFTMLTITVALLWRRCGTLSTSGFVDDVMFSHIELNYGMSCVFGSGERTA